jgi:hypothetical protein
MMAQKSDITDDFRTMIRKLCNDPRFFAWTGDTSISATMKEHCMFSHVDLDVNGGWDTTDVTFIKMLTEEGLQIVNA